MKTARDLIAYANKTALFQSEGLSFPVQIVDCRSAYGRTDFRIRPENGGGEKWVSADRIKLPVASDERRAA